MIPRDQRHIIALNVHEPVLVYLCGDGITGDGSRIEWFKWVQWMRWPGPYEWHRLSVPERSQTYPDMEGLPDSRASAWEALLPTPVGGSRFVIRATHELSGIQ